MTDAAVRRSAIQTEKLKKVIHRCQTGETAAYREIYSAFGTMLFSIAMRMLGSKEDAEDAVQNTFVKLHRHIGQFRFESKFSSYLVSILINVCHDLNKKNNTLLQLYDESDVGQENYTEWGLTLEKAIQMLPVKMRECFVLYAIEGFKQKEIADMLNLSEGTVKAHVFQAKARLREIINPEGSQSL